MSEQHIAIVGAGPAGSTAAKTLRAEGFELTENALSDPLAPQHDSPSTPGHVHSPVENPPGFAALVLHRLVVGVLGGLAGGVVFGIMMGMMGMLPVVASIIDSDSVWVGAGIHLAISMAIGTVMVGLFGDSQLIGFGRGIILGLAFGTAWWVLGALLILPLLLGLPVFQISMASMLSLMGHLLYGMTLSLVAIVALRRVRVNVPKKARRA